MLYLERRGLQGWRDLHILLVLKVPDIMEASTYPKIRFELLSIRIEAALRLLKILKYLKPRVYYTLY